MSKLFTADFETNVSEEDCRVWAYAICEIGNPDNFIYGNSIADFIEWCKSDKKENYTVYFHNLKFDGEYIFSYLLNNGYEVIRDKKNRKDTKEKAKRLAYKITNLFFKVSNVSLGTLV